MWTKIVSRIKIGKSGKRPECKHNIRFLGEFLKEKGKYLVIKSSFFGAEW